MVSRPVHQDFNTSATALLFFSLIVFISTGHTDNQCWAGALCHRDHTSPLPIRPLNLFHRDLFDRDLFDRDLSLLDAWECCPLQQPKPVGDFWKGPPRPKLTLPPLAPKIESSKEKNLFRTSLFAAGQKVSPLAGYRCCCQDCLSATDSFLDSPAQSR